MGTNVPTTGRSRCRRLACGPTNRRYGGVPTWSGEARTSYRLAPELTAANQILGIRFSA